MKRDFDLIRQLLMNIEELPPMTSYRPGQFENYEHSTVVEHIELLIEAGLVAGNVQRVLAEGGGVAQVFRLTWAGHDFLDAAREDTIWQKAKKTVLEPARSFTFELLKEWLKAEARERLGIPG